MNYELPDERSYQALINYSRRKKKKKQSITLRPRNSSF